MCVKKLHHSVNRKICICFTVYVVFGFRIHCGVLGHENHDFPPDRHLEALYKNLTNSEFLHPENLSKLLDDLNIIPLQHGHNDHEEHNHAEIHKEHGEIQKRECYSAEEMVGFFAPNVRLNKSQFASLFPTIVYELHTHACHSDHLEPRSVPANFRDWKVVVACVVAVIVLGSSGLLVVALVPLMSRSFYNVVTQFLIALSVGSLTGDAFLHLIPHALSGGHSHGHKPDQIHNHHVEGADKHEHRDMVMKSLVALLVALELISVSNFSGNFPVPQAQANHVFDEDMSAEKAIGYQRINPNTPYRNGYLHPDNSKSTEPPRSDALVDGEQETSKSKTAFQGHARQLSVPEGLSITHPEVS
ncbi:Zinc transporter foi [Fasciolopsis buskii]|uniref:Zinc transporter foi n=1 Tax=Fasciolopsis buskii TaxID=27845 RepID=A0A8E0RJR7_9TREM|nr:Zinc transporter foi [Fasciolopsis buski]